MATGNCLTNLGKTIALNRTFKAIPDYTAPTCFKVGTGVNTPNITDTDLQTPISIAGSATKTIISGYPVLNETTFQSTIRGIILTTECNGNTLTEFGLFNTDGTKKLFSRLVHTALSKTSSVQVIYVEKDMIGA
jgi:hypothetical protein